MTDQLILLPKQNYFDWVKATRDYVRTFRPNLTSDPATVVNRLNAGDVVTVVNPQTGYGRDIAAWLADQKPGLTIDPITVNTPGDLAAVLADRIQRNDPYGNQPPTDTTPVTTVATTATGPFRLVWPTDYPIVTQPFGVNPQNYNRFGLPGHEGIDIRAPTGANVYAGADGEVSRVETNPNAHAYGIHVRIKHRDGYETILAHLQEAHVNPGDRVKAGQRIGLADNTGNSFGSHLHLTLKKAGATRAGLTNFPNDIIDPTPFLIKPDPVPTGTPAGTPTGIPAASPAFDWKPGKCLIGLHGRADGPMLEPDFAVVQATRMEAIKLISTAPPENVDRLRQINPDMFIMVRLFADFRNRIVPSADFAHWLEYDMGRFYEKGIRYFEVHNEPNLIIEGWRQSWQNGREFGEWVVDVVSRLKPKFPEAKFGYPGLSPGGDVDGQRTDSWRFLDESEKAVQKCDWLACHCYWVDEADRNRDTGGQVWRGFRQRHPNKLLFITEFSNPSDRTSMAVKGQQYNDYYRDLRNVPGIGAAFAFVLSASAYFPHEVWRDENGRFTPVVNVVAQRGF